MPIPAAELRQRADAIRWFHTMELGQGVRTEGTYDPTVTLPRLALPDRLDGLSVLDIGAWDGFYSFEAERRGGSVTACDSFCWDGDGWGTKAGFDLAHEAFDSNVRSVHVDPMHLEPDDVGGSHDIVLFLGVLYHLRDPLVALERLRAVTAKTLILETVVGALLSRRPTAEFFPSGELLGDHSNWWAPNSAAVIGMLESVGFSRVEVVWRRSLPRRAARGAYRMVAPPKERFFDALSRDRFVYHAHV